MGLPEGRHKLGDMDVDVTGIKAVIAGTNTLAGAAVDHVTCIKNFKDFTGCSIVEVVECATLHPAVSLGIQVCVDNMNCVYSRALIIIYTYSLMCLV